MSRQADESVCRSCASNIKSSERQRFQSTELEKPRQLAKHPSGVVWAGLDEIKGPVLDSRISLGDGLCIPKIGLAHLDEASAPAQQSQRRIHEFAGQRIQHHVGSAAPSGRQELLLK